MLLSDVTTPDITPLQFRNTLAYFVTGITVVTTAMGNGLLENDGLVHGMTANAFSAISLDPPLVLISIDRASHMHEFLQQMVVLASAFWRRIRPIWPDILRANTGSRSWVWLLKETMDIPSFQARWHT